MSTAAPAGAAPVTIFKSGSYGYWGGNAGPNVCGNWVAPTGTEASYCYIN